MYTFEKSRIISLNIHNAIQYKNRFDASLPNKNNMNQFSTQAGGKFG